MAVMSLWGDDIQLVPFLRIPLTRPCMNPAVFSPWKCFRWQVSLNASELQTETQRVNGSLTEVNNMFSRLLKQEKNAAVLSPQRKVPRSEFQQNEHLYQPRVYFQNVFDDQNCLQKILTANICVLPRSCLRPLTAIYLAGKLQRHELKSQNGRQRVVLCTGDTRNYFSQTLNRPSLL